MAAAATQPRPSATREVGSGVALNERLTALTGAPLFLLVAAIAVTILLLPQLLPEHYLVGLLLVPPLLLKMATTGYRFARYYTRSAAYRLAGPPPLLLRLAVAPVLVTSTIAVFTTGIELWLFGLRFGSGWMTANTLSAVVFVLATGAHLLAHLRRSAEAAVEEVGASPRESALSRRSLVTASLLLGAVLAGAALLYTTPFPASAAGRKTVEATGRPSQS